MALCATLQQDHDIQLSKISLNTQAYMGRRNRLQYATQILDSVSECMRYLSVNGSTHASFEAANAQEAIPSEEKGS